MSNPQVVSFDPIRTLAFGSILGTYVALGTPFTHAVRLVCLTNNTDGNLYFSTDASTDMLFVAAGSFKLFDLNTNRAEQLQYWVLPVRTQFYVRYITAPTTGSVYLEALWGE